MTLDDSLNRDQVKRAIITPGGSCDRGVVGGGEEWLIENEGLLGLPLLQASKMKKALVLSENHHPKMLFPSGGLFTLLSKNCFTML
jgi:hypothetical protein